jgi:hypothetical protein
LLTKVTEECAEMLFDCGMSLVDLSVVRAKNRWEFAMMRLIPGPLP